MLNRCPMPKKLSPPNIFLLAVVAVCRSATAQVSASDEGRVYLLNRCFISEPAPPAPPPAILGKLGAGLLSNAIPSLVGALYSGVVGALKKAGDSDDLSASAPPIPFYLYEVSNQSGASPAPQLGCVVFAYGKFASSMGIDPPRLASPRGNCNDVCYAVDRPDIAKCQKCVDASLPDAPSDLALLLEAAVTPSQDGGSFFYTARHLQIRRWMQKGRENRPHSFTATFSLEPPGSKADDKVLSVGVLNLGERTTGTIYRSTELASQTGWLTGFGLDESGKAAVKSLGESPTAKTISLSPLTFRAVMTESAAGSKFAAQLATILDGMKSDAVKTIATALDPTQIKKGNEDAASDLETAKQKEEQSYSAYLDAQIANAKVPQPVDTDDTPTKLAKQKLVLGEEVAKRAWCRDQKALSLLQTKPPPDRKVGCP